MKRILYPIPKNTECIEITVPDELYDIFRSLKVKPANLKNEVEIKENCVKCGLTKKECGIK